MSGFFATRVLQPVSPQPGESGYFTSPDPDLDPRLFEGTRVRPDVRNWVLSTLYRFWGGRYVGPTRWSRVWIAGSGISYQWAAGRGNGDLDVLIGVDFPHFFASNPQFQGLSEDDMADVFNAEFHSDLWPQTASTQISAGEAPLENGVSDVFEVTFYVNGRATDIRDIHPYAAYNLTDDEWTVKPPEGAAFEHPKEYYDAAQEEDSAARAVIDRYNRAAGSGDTHMALLAASQASSLFDDIHLGRKNAFGPGGSGYGDFFNFRWQYAKRSGLIATLRAVAQVQQEAQDEFARRTYGSPIGSAAFELRQAALWNRGGNGR